MRYPAVLHREKEGIWVSFPDVPEAMTHGSSEEDALAHALDALETALDLYFDAKEPVPLPSQPKRGQRMVTLPVSVAATVLLHNEMLAQRVRPAEVAKRMGIPKQQMTRILNLRHATKVDTIAAALETLGKRLEIQIV